MHSLLSVAGRNFSVVEADYLLRVLMFSHGSHEMINWIGQVVLIDPFGVFSHALAFMVTLPWDSVKFF